MKREYVIPDLLARLTADALFAGTPRSDAAVSPATTQPSAMRRLSRWFKRAPDTAVDSAPRVTARHTLTDDWAGGWYARTRLLQAATLAQHAANGVVSPSATGAAASSGAPDAVPKAAS